MSVPSSAPRRDLASHAVLAIGLAGAAAAAVALAGCGRRPLASCDDDLRGVYADRERPAERWMILDRGDALEAYAVFPDADGPGPEGADGVVAAPREIELHRGSGALPAGTAPIAGTLHRRYMRRADRCDARVAVHVARCAGDAIELVLADPAPPTGFAPCTWPPPGASRVARWRRN
jgi:hypothetical protein